MVNHGNGIILERLHVCQCLCSHSFTRKVGQTEVVVFQQFHKVGGGAGLEPVAAELQGTEGIQQAEGVIQIGSVLAEAVAVVPFFQSQADLVVGDTVVFRLSGAAVLQNRCVSPCRSFRRASGTVGPWRGLSGCSGR